jgi:amino acid transporter
LQQQWLVGSIFILFIGMAMADLASAAPTSGGVCFLEVFPLSQSN